MFENDYRIPDIPSIKSKELNIQITTDCNLHCPWCLGWNTTTEGKWDNYIFNKFENYIRNNSYEHFSLMGGETLLYKDSFLKIISLIRKYYKNSKIKCFTNGILLTEDYIKIINLFKIKCVIAFQLYGNYKTFNNAFNINPNIKDLILKLNDINIRSVLIKEIKSFSEEAINLYKTFKCNIELTLDLMNMEKITIEDIKFIKSEINKIKKQCGNNSISWLCSTNKNYCDCLRNTKTFFMDGEVAWDSKSVEKYAGIGCGVHRKRMKPEVYEELIKN